MNITIKINTDNAAFQGENGAVELSRILNDCAEQVEVFGICLDMAGSLRDVNGNCVGSVEVTE